MSAITGTVSGSRISHVLEHSGFYLYNWKRKRLHTVHTEEGEKWGEGSDEFQIYESPWAGIYYAPDKMADPELGDIIPVPEHVVVRDGGAVELQIPYRPKALDDAAPWPTKPVVFSIMAEVSVEEAQVLMLIRDYQEPVEASFEKELERLINKHSAEGHSNTPDFILATYLADCLEAYGKATKRRDEWYGYGTGNVVEGSDVPEPADI